MFHETWKSVSRSSHMHKKRKNLRPATFLLLALWMGFGGGLFGQTENPFVKQSKDFVQAIKSGYDIQPYLNAYSDLNLNELSKGLNTKNEKLAFWINTYNGFIQLVLMKDPDLYQDRGDFFKEERLDIAGIEMSFDDLEHSIMRNSTNKLSGGYLRKWFEPKWVCKLRNEEIDGRIHFALNCGAISCPPVAIYDDTTLDKDLDFISKQYLTDHTRIKKEKVYTTALFSWFRGDFGGLSGVKDFLKKYQIVGQDIDIDLEFNDYDWTLSLGNYTELP